MKTVLHILMLVVNCTWGMIQSCFGFAIFLYYIKKPHFCYKGSIITTKSIPKLIGGASIGAFIFITDDINKDIGSYMIVRHEYGHFLQSLLLGPLYLLAIGIPSVLKNEFVENWADKWGKANRNYYRAADCTE